VFDVTAEGKLILDNLDIFSAAGGKNKAYDVTVPVTVSDGALNLNFTTVKDNAKISAIRIESLDKSDGEGGGDIAATNAGGAAFTAAGGTPYSADRDFSGGKIAKVTAAIANTTDDALYQSERYGNFSYAVPVADGTYDVTLQFAETYWNAAGKRVFDVTAEGKLILDNLDIFSAAGGKNKAYDVTVPVTVSDGALNLNFTTVKDNAKISAIRIESLGNGNGATTIAQLHADGDHALDDAKRQALEMASFQNDAAGVAADPLLA
jgi:malectin (di-glucose binding ER protein)